MAEPHSIEFRRRVVEAYESGEGGYGTIAARFKVSRITVRRWVDLYRREGHVSPRKKRGGTPSLISLPELRSIVEKLGDPTAGEIAAEYNRGRRGEERHHVSSIKRALHRGGFVVKKNASDRSSNSAQTSSKSARRS